MAFNLEEVDVDGAVREAYEEVAGDTRLSFLKKGALAGGAALSGGAILAALTGGTAMAATNDRARPPASYGSGDVGVLNYALTLEYLEATFYAEAMSNHVARGDKALSAFLGETARDEAKHVAFLVKALGSSAAKKPTFDFGKAVTDKSTFMDTSYVLENTGVHAYHGQLTNLTSTQNVIYAAEIATVEGRHAGAIGILSGKAIAPLSGFDSPLGAPTVLAAVTATHFITS